MEYLNREFNIIRGMLDGGVCLKSAVSDAMYDDGLMNVALRCLSVIAHCQPRRMGEVVEVMSENVFEGYGDDEMVVRGMCESWTSMMNSDEYGDMLRSVLDDDVGRYGLLVSDAQMERAVRAVSRYNVSLSDPLAASDASPFVLPLLFGSSRIFAYVCSAVDVRGMVRMLNAESRKLIAAVSVVGCDMDVIDVLAGYGIDYSEEGVVNRYNVGCDVGVVHSMLRKCNGRKRASPKQMMMILGSYCYGLVDKYGMVCDKVSIDDVDCCDVPHSLSVVKYMCEVCSMMQCDVVNAVMHLVADAVVVGDANFIKYVYSIYPIDIHARLAGYGSSRDVLCDVRRDYTLLDYVIHEGSSVVLNALHINITKLPLHARIHMLCSRDSAMFECGVGMRDVINSDITPQISKLVELGEFGRVVVVLKSIKQHSADKADVALESVIDVVGVRYDSDVWRALRTLAGMCE